MTKWIDKTPALLICGTAEEAVTRCVNSLRRRESFRQAAGFVSEKVEDSPAYGIIQAKTSSRLREGIYVV